jgi:hypothetical protein
MAALLRTAVFDLEFTIVGGCFGTSEIRDRQNRHDTNREHGAIAARDTHDCSRSPSLAEEQKIG